MYFITGRIVENGKLTAYGLYDLNERKATLMSKKSIKNLVVAGREVVGFERYENTFTGLAYARKNRGYMWKNLPDLNGKGEPEKPEDKHNKVLIGTNGFKELREFVTVNSTGEVNVYTSEEFKAELSKDCITGAVLAEDGRILSQVKNEITDKWLKEAGFERGKDKVWFKKEQEQIEEQPEQIETTA